MPELTTEQKRELKRWERRMRLAAAVAGTIFFLFVVFGWLTREVAAVVYVYLALIALALLWGAHVRFAERCPNCGARIGAWFGVQAYIGLPRNCRQCGVTFQ